MSYQSNAGSQGKSLSSLTYSFLSEIYVNHLLKGQGNQPGPWCPNTQRTQRIAKYCTLNLFTKITPSSSLLEMAQSLTHFRSALICAELQKKAGGTVGQGMSSI